MLSSLPRIRSSISPFLSLKLACKSWAASPVSRSGVIAPLSTTLLSSPHTTFYGRNYTHCGDFERSYTQQQRHQQLLINHTTTSYLGLRQFSRDTKQSNKKKDLRESIDRLKSSIESESSSSSSNGDPNNPSNDNNNNSSSSSNNPHLETISSIGTSFLRSLAQTWDELIASGQAKDINKKIGSAANREGDGDKPNYSNDVARISWSLILKSIWVHGRGWNGDWGMLPLFKVRKTETFIHSTHVIAWIYFVSTLRVDLLSLIFLDK